MSNADAPADEPTWAAPAARFAGVSDVTVLYSHQPYAFALPAAQAVPVSPAIVAPEIRVVQRRTPAKPSFLRRFAPTLAIGMGFGLVAPLGCALAVSSGLVPTLPAACFAIGLVCFDIAYLAVRAALCVR